MTLTDLQALASTDEGRERIRVMVAEALNWTDVRMYYGTMEGGTYDGLIGTTPLGSKRMRVPLWTTSLNACAELEAGLTDEEWDRYADALFDIAANESPEVAFINIALSRVYVSASALHRCIALVLTKQETKGADRE